MPRIWTWVEDWTLILFWLKLSICSVTMVCVECREGNCSEPSRVAKELVVLLLMLPARFDCFRRMLLDS